MKYMGIYLTAFKTGNTDLRWIIKVMNFMGIFISYQFHDRGVVSNVIFSLLGKEPNKFYTHYSRLYEQAVCKKLDKKYGSIIA